MNLGVGEEFVQIGGLYAGSVSELGELLHHLQELLADLRGVNDLEAAGLRAGRNPGGVAQVDRIAVPSAGCFLDFDMSKLDV